MNRCSTFFDGIFPKKLWGIIRDNSDKFLVPLVSSYMSGINNAAMQIWSIRLAVCNGRYVIVSLWNLSDFSFFNLK